MIPRVAIRGAAESGSEAVEVARIGLNHISGILLEELESLYAQAFHASRMHQRLVEDIASAPEIFGARVIESKSHPEFYYRGNPPVHGKRFCVSSTARGHGVGRSLIAAGKDYCFGELRLKAIFGESNEIGALALHGREGALFSLDSIEKCSRRNSAVENVGFLREFLRAPAFRRYRLPAGSGIRFVYCNDPQTAQSFMAAGHVSVSQLCEAP
jgi:GNAT superfamily N-acetyltransferase